MKFAGIPKKSFKARDVKTLKIYYDRFFIASEFNELENDYFLQNTRDSNSRY